MTTPVVERSVDRAHAVIREFVRQAGSAAGEDPRALVALLRHTLPAHFAFEERAGGFLERLEQHGVPALRVDRLRGEHREFLDRLERLEAAVARGEDASTELAALAARLREHEWLESTSAVQAGFRAPADPPREIEGLASLRPEVVGAIVAIAEHAHGLACRTPGELLAGLTVAVPDTVPVEAARALLEDELSERGLDFVDVVVCAGDGAVTLRDAHFHRPR
jgi:hypothetical protein